MAKKDSLDTMNGPHTPWSSATRAASAAVSFRCSVIAKLWLGVLTSPPARKLDALHHAQPRVVQRAEDARAVEEHPEGAFPLPVSLRFRCLAVPCYPVSSLPAALQALGGGESSR